MAKIIKGRIDNSINFFFHHQRRRIEKDEGRSSRYKTLEVFQNEIHMDRVANIEGKNAIYPGKYVKLVVILHTAQSGKLFKVHFSP